ncbi:MAG: radical SAM protein [Candidatus Hydrogenedentota bacterium]
MKNRKIKKVLLFVPPAYTFKNYIDINPLPSLGLAYIAAVLRLRGIEVKIVDSLLNGWNNREIITEEIIRIGLPFEKIERIIIEESPEVVGVNCLFTKQRENAHKIFEISKKINKDIINIAGGPHPSAMPELVLSDPNLDWVVIGEGEQTLFDIVDTIEGKKDFSILDGVGFRHNGDIKIIPKTRYITDLDSLPFPARELLNMKDYFGLKSSHGTRERERFSPIITSRGCPAKCTFCSAHKVWGHKYRVRSPENVILEMRELKEKYDIEEIMFEDDNFNLDVKRANKILDMMIQEKFNFIWNTPNGFSAWTVTEDFLFKMKESGCSRVSFAIESGNQFVLDNIIKKPIRLEKIKNLIKYAKKIKLKVGIFLIVGMPGETKEQIWDTFKLAEELEIYEPFISVAAPYPGSEIYEICKEKKYFSKNYSLDNLYIRGFPITTEEWTDEELKKILQDGKTYLYFSFLKNKPFKFLQWFVPRFMEYPIPILKRITSYFIEKLQKLIL